LKVRQRLTSVTGGSLLHQHMERIIFPVLFECRTLLQNKDD
jgi:hypothetical protein